MPLPSVIVHRVVSNPHLPTRRKYHAPVVIAVWHLQSAIVSWSGFGIIVLTRYVDVA